MFEYSLISKIIMVERYICGVDFSVVNEFMFVEDEIVFFVIGKKLLLSNVIFLVKVRYSVGFRIWLV